MISYNSHDLGCDACVPVIASFSSDGHIAPLYVRINGISLKVDSFWVRSQFRNIVEFQCKVLDECRLKPVALIYHRTEDVWTIPAHYLNGASGD